MKKALSHYFILISILTVTLLLCFQATGFASSTIITKRTTTLNASKKEANSVSITFTTKKNMVFIMPIKITSSDHLSKGGIRIQLINAKNKIIQNDFISYKNFDEKGYWDFVYTDYFYSDGLLQKPGSYTYKIISTLNGTSKVTWSVDGYIDTTRNIKFVKDSTLGSSYWNKIAELKSFSKYFPHIKKIVTSNASIIPKDNYYSDLKGNLYVYPLEPGPVNLTIELVNGKQYTKSFIVTPPDPNFYASLSYYYTRDNYIQVEIKNMGIGDLTILSKNAMLYNKDYKTYDRRVKLSESAKVIKPGKTRHINFSISGRNTWPEINRFWLEYQFMYYGKTYTARAYTSRYDSEYKDGKTWYYTYWRN